MASLTFAVIKASQPSLRFIGHSSITMEKLMISSKMIPMGNILDQ